MVCGCCAWLGTASSSEKSFSDSSRMLGKLSIELWKSHGVSGTIGQRINPVQPQQAMQCAPCLAASLIEGPHLESRSVDQRIMLILSGDKNQVTICMHRLLVHYLPGSSLIQGCWSSLCR